MKRYQDKPTPDSKQKLQPLQDSDQVLVPPFSLNPKEVSRSAIFHTNNPDLLRI
jgi:hypothetical protein